MKRVESQYSVKSRYYFHNFVWALRARSLDRPTARSPAHVASSITWYLPKYKNNTFTLSPFNIKQHTTTAMPVTNKRTRKALAESIPASLGDNIKPQDVDIVPAKKAKKNPTNSKAKEPKASAANPPAFLTEVILPGEGDVFPWIPLKLILEQRRRIRRLQYHS